MPPSTHYLNLLNLNHAEDNLQQEEFTDADISKQLELFTNSNFLDTEPFAYQPFDASAYDAQLNTKSNAEHPHGERYRSASVTAPRNQRQQFQPPMQPVSRNSALPVQDLANIDYMHQFNSMNSSYTNSPVATKRSAEEAEIYSATPASSDAGGEDRKGGRTLDDEDKRRRNTAASARFRIKKKQREQALQESAKAMTDKNSALESRVRELELENKWLRSLLKPVNAEQTKNVLASI